MKRGTRSFGTVLGLTLGLFAAASSAQAQCETIRFASSLGGTVNPGGTSLPASQCDDCAVLSQVAPFPLRFPGVTTDRFSVSSNGVISAGSSVSINFNPQELPWAEFGSSLFPFWTDLVTTGPGKGIFVATTGIAPTRRFEVIWRGTTITANATVNFSVIFNESGEIPFEFHYNQSGGFGAAGEQAVIGVQATPLGPATTFSAFQSSIVLGRKITAKCAAPTFTYQGRLASGGTPADGAFAMTFALVNQLGANVSDQITLPNVQVTQGLFTVPLSFTNADLAAENLFLRISVNGVFVTPDQPLDYSPRAGVAVRAQTVSWFGVTDRPTEVTNPVWSRNLSNAVSNQVVNVGIGTDAPLARLDVRGEIRFGGSGEQRPVSSSHEQLRLVRGRVLSTGAVAEGSGFVVARTPGAPVGDYTITFSPSFSDDATVTATAFGSIARASINAVAPGSFRIQMFSGTNVLTDATFNFIAVGPR